MYKVHHQYIPRVFENYHIENGNVHDCAARHVDHIHIAYASTNRHDMTMQFQGGLKCPLLEIKYHIMAVCISSN